MREVGVGAFWKTLGQRAIGATVVTAAGRDGPAGFLGLSATHVEASPPTMLVTVGRNTSAVSAMLQSRHFAINFLPQSAAALADAFGGKNNVKGAARFNPSEWTTLVTGAPVLRLALGVFDCELEETIERANCIIAIGRVVAAATTEDGAPLVLFGGRTGTFSG